MKTIAQYWLRSRFVREEVLRLSLIVVLGLWAITATAVALLKTEKTILIGVSDDSSYVISNSNEALRRKEVVSFIRSFIESYYEFSPANHAEKLSRAGDMMTPTLWEQKRPDLQRLNERLKIEPLVQTAKILSIDMVDDETIEALLQVQIVKRLESVSKNLKVTLKMKAHDRSDSNPWPIEISEVTDAVL